jgi:murein DD-endopeptidase MepM/ murein hydrolase activator NlpD
LNNIAKFSNKIDWDYNVRENLTSSAKRTPKKASRTLNRKFNIDYSFSKFSGYKKQERKKHRKIKLKNNRNITSNPNSIYFGILFVLIFGLLFFLTISISSASPMMKETYNDDNLYGTGRSVSLLRDYLVFKDVNPQKKEPNVLPTAKVEFSKYRIKKNDTIAKVAQKFGLSSDTIILTNNLIKKRSLRPGDILLIPNQDGRTIEVKNNDSVFKIANRYGIKWEKLADVNNIRSSVLIAGMKLFIPGSEMTNYEKEHFFGETTIWPVRGNISSYFGPRIDPFTGIYSFHTGLDIKNNPGTPVKTVRKGKVIYVGWQNIYGNFIIIRHENNLLTTYGHLEETFVKKGQDVVQGEVIASVGSSGRSTGPHLHFEVRQYGRLIDPIKILK